MSEQAAEQSTTRQVVTSEILAKLYQPADPAPDTTKPEPTTADTKSEADDKPKTKKPLIEELVRTRHERNDARTENEQLRAELDEVKANLQALQQPVEPKQLDPKPERSQFVSDADYLEALADWKTDQKIAEKAREEQQARIDAAQRQMQENWESRVKAAKTQHLTDFEEVVGKADFNVTAPVYQAIVESDNGPYLAYYLSQNPDEVKRLNGMSPVAAVRMLTRLEDRLMQDYGEKKPEEEETKKPEPEKSKAPPPIDPLKNASSPVEKPTSQMTYQEYKAYRQSQQASQRRR